MLKKIMMAQQIIFFKVSGASLVMLSCFFVCFLVLKHLPLLFFILKECCPLEKKNEYEKPSVRFNWKDFRVCLLFNGVL